MFRKTLALGLFATLQLRAQPVAELHTQQTFIKVQAGAVAPKLLLFGVSRKTSWSNTTPEKLIDTVEIDGRPTRLSWKFRAQVNQHDPHQVSFVYDAYPTRLRLTWQWRAPAATGPIEHTIRIENRGSREVWIPMQDSFTYRWRVDPSIPLRHFFVEKGAGEPSLSGTHETELSVGYHCDGFSSTYAHPTGNQPREIIPFFAVETAGPSSQGWYAGIEFSGRTRLTLARNSLFVEGRVGLNPDPGPFRTRLKPGETFESPTVFLGAFTDGIDNLGNVLRPWVRKVLGNPRTWQDPHYPLMVNNSWGSGMLVDEPLALHMIQDSAELGVEMFHMDAGWFRGVGDWYPDPHKFPHGLAAIAAAAHHSALKFGLWVDWTQAGLDDNAGALNLHDPAVHNWTVSDLPADWKPDAFKGQTTDLGEPAARAYAEREVNRIVDQYQLDMLEHDGYVVAQGCVRENHPHAAPDRARMSIVKDQGSYFVESSNSTDVSYHAVRAYYDIYANLRRSHPELLLEICNDGGRMVDFGSAAHGDYFSITDAYDPLSNRRAFYDASHVLPAAMLETYVQKWPTPTLANFRYMLRSGMMGWLTIMQDTNAWSAEQHAAAKQEFRLYREQLRPLIRDADLYHLTPRADGIHWDGIEYFDSRRRKGVIYAFRGSGENEPAHIFPLRGLDPAQQYRLRFQDQSAPDRTISGRDLLEHGVSLTLATPNSSELVFID
jgi:hypothetical protein